MSTPKLTDTLTLIATRRQLIELSLACAYVSRYHKEKGSEPSNLVDWDTLSQELEQMYNRGAAGSVNTLTSRPIEETPAIPKMLSSYGDQFISDLQDFASDHIRHFNAYPTEFEYRDVVYGGDLLSNVINMMLNAGLLPPLSSPAQGKSEMYDRLQD